MVETEDMFYLVEVKDSRRLTDPEVLSNKEKAIKYCKVATEYNKANGHKGFKYLFIPHDMISSTSRFNALKDGFVKND